MRQRRAPRMENGYDADAGAQVFGISRNRDHRLGREQDVVDRRLVLIGDVGNDRRQREHEVIIGDGQEFGLALGKPRLRRRAGSSLGVVCCACCRTGLAPGNLPAIAPWLSCAHRQQNDQRRDQGEETLAEIGRSYNVSGWTISRLEQ
jgi:hypothetical protein